MTRLHTIFLSLLAAMLLSGCYSSQTLDTLRKTEPKGTVFQTELAKLYRSYAEMKLEQHAWKDADLFAAKGLQAALGQDVMPEDPAKWAISGDNLTKLTEARATLLNATKDPVPTDMPQAAASLQFYYDCWVDQQADATQADAVTPCKDDFFEALANMNIVPAVPAAPVATTTAPATSYLAFFDWSSSELTAEAKQVVASLITDLKAREHYEVVLSGHTDTSGPEDFNLELSQKRANIVREALMSSGISDDAITLYAYGESDPRIATGDDVREPVNRRVEISINP